MNISKQWAIKLDEQIGYTRVIDNGQAELWPIFFKNESAVQCVYGQK